MAKDVSDVVRDVLGQVAREAAQNIGADSRKPSSGPLSGMRGVAAGAGLAALAPLAMKGAGWYLRRRLLSAAGVDSVRDVASDAKSKLGGTGSKIGEKVGGTVGKTVKDTVGDKVGGTVGKTVKDTVGDKAGGTVGQKVKDTVGKVGGAGGVGGIAKETGESARPDVRSDGADDGVEGVGKGRRMPVQQSVDVAVPIETAYNQWTQFEDWPTFMHRVTRVTQQDDCTVSFATKIWGVTKEFRADIETQRPDERIKWRVSDGVTHTGVVTFHELAPRLTRIELDLDVDPGSLIEKAARGMRHVKRAVRADLHRFKAFIELREEETGAWRGVIEDGELVEPHPEDYDEELEYRESDEEVGADPEDRGEAPEAAAPGEEEQGDGSQEAKSRRFERQARASMGGGRARRPSGSGQQRSSRQRKEAGRR